MASLKFVISRCSCANRRSKFPSWPAARPADLSGSDVIWPLLVNTGSVSSESGSSGTGRFTFFLISSNKPGIGRVGWFLGLGRGGKGGERKAPPPEKVAVVGGGVRNSRGFWEAEGADPR